MGIAPRTGGLSAANMAAPMPSCTSDIASSFLIQVRDMRPGGEGRRRYPQREGFCSAAGLQRRPWFHRLRHALENDLFVLHYQPIVALRPERVGGPITERVEDAVSH